ncbi:hypothetical protein [Flavobacterium sp.]|jgi:nucleoside-specific outer membrane channel protein Tsx|uniref:hypothetical protein n=1 Tax=Flavobacterium sp. TaxID=239 RepID=UPI00374C8CAE
MSLSNGALLSLLLHKVLHYKDANETNILLYSIKTNRYIIPIIDFFSRLSFSFQGFIDFKFIAKKKKP